MLREWNFLKHCVASLPQFLHILILPRFYGLECVDEMANTPLGWMQWNRRREMDARKFDMRKTFVILLAASGLSALVTNPAVAFGTRYPFCLQSDEWPGLSNCTFTSYAQCQATASGRRLYCIENPYFDQGEREPRADRGRNRPRSVYPSY